MNCIIRKAVANDAPVLTQLSRDVINHNFRAFMGDEAVDGYIGSGMADKEIAGNLENMDVLLYGGDVIGLCIWHGNLLHLLMIAPEHQGTGAAAYFLQHLCEDKFQTCDELRLECFENNKRANAFYEKQGWAVYKVKADAGTGWNRLFYKKTRT